MKRLVFVLAAISLLFPAVVSADTPSPSEGIPVPDPSIATQSDSSSLELNPAGLGFLEGVEAAYGAFIAAPDYAGVVPSGHALTLGGGGSSGGLGVGMQWMDNPRLGPDRTSFRKFTLGGALSPSPYISLGGNINFFGSRTNERLNSLRTTDFGIQLRPASTVGFGFVARDVRAAFLDEDRALPRRFGTGVAYRAFEGRLVLDTEIHHVQGADGFQVRPRIAGEPISGLRLFGQGQVDASMPNGSLDPSFAGASFGLEVSTGTSGIQSAAQLGRFGTADASTPTGASYRLWTGTPQKRPLFTRRSRWIRLDLDDSIAEQATTRLFGATSNAFLGLINDIDAIAEDPSVEGVILEVGRFDLGYAQLWELHQAIERLHDAGKRSIAFIASDIPSTQIVYAASAAQEVWMRPVSPYSPTGLQVEFTSYAGLLEKAGLEAEFMRIGDYKSAPESFVLPGPSEPALEQTGEVLDTIYAELTERIAERRGLEPDEIRNVIDNTPLYPAEALDKGLVDALVYDEEMDDRLRQLVGSPFGPESGYQRYEIADKRWGARPEIAVVYVDGVITSGRSGGSPFGTARITGAETLTETLRQLGRNDNIKAVVLRIDSPGGSAFGSDLIYRELRHLATRKPVVASMGNVAASGGYYAAAGADEIFATPVSVTGSIGIFVGKFNIDSLADTLGINSQDERRGERAGAFSPWRSWSDAERDGIAKQIEFLYELFLQQVARTRPLSPQEVDEVARGRVWTGEAARQQGLVDTTGGISDALSRAEELAGLEAGEAIYTDRTGAGGTALSPGIATGLSRLLAGAEIITDASIAPPEGQITSAIKGLESSLIWPLYFGSKEPVFMPPYHFSMY